MLKLSNSKGTISIDMPKLEENGLTISFSESEISIKHTTIEEKKKKEIENSTISIPTRGRKPKPQKEKSVVESTDLTLEEAITTEKESVEEVDKPKADPEIDPETESVLNSALERFRRMGVNKATPVDTIVKGAPLPDEEILLFGPDEIKNHPYGVVKNTEAFKKTLSSYKTMAKNSPNFELPNPEAELQLKKLI